MTKKKMLLKSSAHNNRVVPGVRTNQINEVDEFLKKGGGIQDITYTLRYPEVMVIDLSNLEPPLSICSGNNILDVFNFIKHDLPNAIEGTDFHIIYGDGLDTEIAISGESLYELAEFKEKYLSSILDKFKINIKYDLLSLVNTKGITVEKDINCLKDSCINFYKCFIKRYEDYIKPEYRSRTKILNLTKYPHEHSVWKDIQSLGENKLFVLTSGLPLSLSYISSTDDFNINFVEVHRENDANFLFKKKELSGLLLPCLDHKDKSWVVIDKAYTGGTINIAAEKVKGIYGKSTKVTRVGLYPKTYESLKCLDYVVFAGRLISTNYILTEFSEFNWYEQLILESHKSATNV